MSVPWRGPDKTIAKEMAARGLGSTMSPDVGRFSDQQNNAVLIVGIVCACISLAAAVVALRWFVLMKRLFRHRLVLFLIMSDTFKAIWYFVFSVVSFASGPVSTKSSFCQASGFFLLLAVEAADFAILIIAINTMVSIFKPKSKEGEGGLYPVRHWIYPFWLGPPVLAASLAFVNNHEAYVTSGTYCFLPKRPFWYRLALSWIPRYIIITTILMMYLSIYIYVHIKFRGFSNLMEDSSEFESTGVSRRSAQFYTLDQMEEKPSISGPSAKPTTRPSASRMHSYDSTMQNSQPTTSGGDAPWDAMNFITSRPLHASAHHDGIATEDFAGLEADTNASDDTEVAPHEDVAELEKRKPSEAPTVNTTFTTDTQATRSPFPTLTDGNRRVQNDPLRNTRIAIRRQLRFMFIYPIIYILMWTFPFVYHSMNYDDYYVEHPIYWLYLTQTIFIALQAGIDSVVFSWREKPWRRIDANSRGSVSFLSRKGKEMITGSNHGSKSRSAPGSLDATAAIEPPKPARNALWWEAEGRKRKDSIWMGTDSLAKMASRNTQRSTSPRPETIEE